MKKAILFMVFLPGLISPVIGQTPENVESAVRFRELKQSTQIEKNSSVQNLDFFNLRILENKSSSQLDNLGSRWGWGKSSAQLEDLGSRWGWGKSSTL